MTVVVRVYVNVNGIECVKVALKGCLLHKEGILPAIAGNNCKSGNEA